MLLAAAAAAAAAARYGNEESDFVTPFVPHRGGGRSAFGILEWGGCGLTNGDGTIPWPKVGLCVRSGLRCGVWGP